MAGRGRLRRGPSGVAALAGYPEQHEVVFARIREGQIVVSADSGASWQDPR